MYTLPNFINGGISLTLIPLTAGLDLDLDLDLIPFPVCGPNFLFKFRASS